MTRRLAPLALACFAAAAALACGDDTFSTPNAFAEEPDLCADQAAFDAELSACKSAGSCGGVASFNGVLQGRPVQVATRLEKTIFTFLSIDGAPFKMDRLEGLGQAPYFGVAMQLKSIGDGDGRRTTARSSDAIDHLDDDEITFELRLSSAGESRAVESIDGGIADIVQREGELELDFDMAFTDGDSLIGCAHFLATDVVNRVE